MMEHPVPVFHSTSVPIDGSSKAFGRLQDEGVVELRRRRIYVRHQKPLRRIAEQER
jgi:hypothetical protein